LTACLCIWRAIGVPKFISERKHLHVPLEAYFKAVKYDDDINDRRDAECLEKEAITVEPESMEEDEGESDGPSSSSPIARQNHVKKQEKAVLEQDDSATGKLSAFLVFISLCDKCRVGE
jgi:hypothetical protein